MTPALLKITGYSPFKTLLIREYWENRRSMFYWPMVGAGLSVALALFALFYSNIHISDGEISISNEGLAVSSFLLEELSGLSMERRGEAMSKLVISMGFIIGLGTWIVMISNSLSSLYDERQDNSILFWKSMPVSDHQTVLSKIVSNVFVTPLVALLFIFLTQLVILVLLSLFTLGTPYSAWELFWEPLNLPTLFLNELVIVLMYSLWALPVFAYLILASAYAKRTPFLTAVLPVVVITIIEAIFYDHSYLMEWLDNHLGGELLFRYVTLGDVEYFTILNSLEILKTATLPSFWIGLGLAGLMIFASIHLRRRNNQ